MEMIPMGENSEAHPSTFVDVRSVLHRSTVTAEPGTAAYYAMSEAAFAALPSRIPKGFEYLLEYEISICLLAAQYRDYARVDVSFDTAFSTALQHAVEARRYPMTLRGLGERVLRGPIGEVFIATDGLTGVRYIESLIPYAAAGVKASELLRAREANVPFEYAAVMS